MSEVKVMNREMKNKLMMCGALAFALGACVDHRDVRNGLSSEAIYLTKTDLTAPNPKTAPMLDDGWLYKVTVVKASAPNVLGDYAFPGIESEARYVKFRFGEDALQMIDGRSLQQDDANDPNDNLSTQAQRVMLEFAGRNVDIKLHESLDGERTNLLEENTELPWQQRQKFRVDFEKSSLDPIANMAWFYGDLVHDCVHVMSTTLVPDSYEWDGSDQYMSFVLEVTYQLKLDSYYGACYDLVSLATGTGSSTIQYRFSFYRPGPSTYTAEEIAEKAEVNKKYGVFQDFTVFRDETTGLLSAKSLMQRWNPNRTEPVVFYFEQGYPERFKPMWTEIKQGTNDILSAAGASLRIDFKEWNDGGIERHFGDIRYSFVTWHQSIDSTRGLLGYGPSSSDPRTGEVISANVNLYNIGMDWYRFLIQDFLEVNGGKAKPDPQKPWEQISCTMGETAAPIDATGRLKSTMFEEMRRTMDLPPSTETSIATDDFLPTPHRGRDAFLSDYHRTLGEIRYVNPLWNPYVYMPTGQLPIGAMPERMVKERAFKTAMSSIEMNQDPFGGINLSTHAGVQAQIDFMHNFRDWKKNHDLLMEDQEMMLATRRISTFDANDALTAISSSARQCKSNGYWESDQEYQERVIEDVVEHVAIHEFGHNLGLRHNFYGSVDAKHMQSDQVSASVMDYVGSWEEAGHNRGWGGYDAAAISWIYGTQAVREAKMKEDFLYCTDEHRGQSALCTAHDLGITPAQVVLNALERYDWLYSIRNQRSFRTFWDTSGYIYSVYNSVFPILRIWYLAIFDWGGGGVQGTLKRLDEVAHQKDPTHPVLTDQQYDEIAMDFYNDISQAVELIIAFYDAVINQPASFRDYQTKFDPYYGDVIQLGIIIDKLFTTFAFMDLQEVYNYNPNIYTYVSLYDAPFGPTNLAVSQRVLDNMLGASYDTFPWFKYTALALFASGTNTNLLSNVQLKDRIAIRRYENPMEMERDFWPGIVQDVVSSDNPEQTFTYEGKEYVYTYLRDQGWHLVSEKSRCPVSYQYIKDYNQALNGQADPDMDNYGLKILLAYYEYFDNFVGF